MNDWFSQQNPNAYRPQNNPNATQSWSEQLELQIQIQRRAAADDFIKWDLERQRQDREAQAGTRVSTYDPRLESAPAQLTFLTGFEPRTNEYSRGSV